MRRFFFLLGTLSCLGFLGCTGDSNAEVSGTVLIDGTPLQQGEIIFEGSDGGGTPAAGSIVDGKYTVKVLPGSKKVKIKASRPTSKPDPLMGTAAREALIGPEFNDRTILKADVKPGRNEGVDFQVKALPRKR